MLTASVSPSVAMLFAPDAEVRVEGLRVAEGGVIHVALLSPRHTAPCPLCGQQASRVHSAYSRSLADLAWRGFPVRFAERLGDLAAPFARRTTRLAATLTHVGMALGGEAGARLL